MLAWENKEPENWGSDEVGTGSFTVMSQCTGRGGAAYWPSPIWRRMVTFCSVLREVPQTLHTGTMNRNLWLLSKESTDSSL